MQSTSSTLRKLTRSLLGRIRHGRQRSNMQHVIDQFETPILDDFEDAFFDFGVVKFDDGAGVDAYDVIVLVALV